MTTPNANAYAGQVSCCSVASPRCNNASPDPLEASAAAPEARSPDPLEGSAATPESHTTYPLLRTVTEIAHQRDLAGAYNDAGESSAAALTYEDGIAAMADWLLGDEDDPPITHPYDPRTSLEQLLYPNTEDLDP